MMACASASSLVIPPSAKAIREPQAEQLGGGQRGIEMLQPQGLCQAARRHHGFEARRDAGAQFRARQIENEFRQPEIFQDRFVPVCDCCQSASAMPVASNTS